LQDQHLIVAASEPYLEDPQRQAEAEKTLSADVKALSTSTPHSLPLSLP